MKKFENVLILTDMDGTFLNSDSQISPSDREAVDYFISEGGLFSVATGRAKKSVEGFLPGLRTSAPSIVHNGALIVDLNDNSTFRQCDLGEEGYCLVEDVLNMFPQVGIEICLPDDQYVARNNMFTKRHHIKVGLELKLRSYKEVARPWLKLNLAADYEVLLDVKEHVLRKYKADVFAQFSSPHYYEIMASGASKGDSALWLREHLGIRPEDFYTVGDGTNDLELVRASGANSCATANAEEIILKNASHILPDNDSGAIAALIGRLDKKYL